MGQHSNTIQPHLQIKSGFTVYSTPGHPLPKPQCHIPYQHKHQHHNSPESTYLTQNLNPCSSCRSTTIVSEPISPAKLPHSCAITSLKLCCTASVGFHAVTAATHTAAAFACDGLLNSLRRAQAAQPRSSTATSRSHGSVQLPHFGER